jgi:nucleoid DNA-binding protein
MENNIMALGKYELTKRIATKAQLTQKQAALQFDTTLCAIREALEGGDDVRLVGFGSFHVRTIKARRATHPTTHETLMVPAHTRVKFSAGKALKQALRKDTKGPWSQQH